MGIFEKRVCPSDCTLAIALPLTRDEFIADLRPEAPKDYAKFYRSYIGGRLSQEELWVKYRDSVSYLIEGVATEVERLGVKVVRGVRLMDMPSLLSDREVLTLVSHWRPAEVEPHDFLNFPRFLEKLMNSPDEVIGNIRSRLSSEVASCLQRRELSDEVYTSLQQSLVVQLNSLLESENLGGRKGFDSSEGEELLHVEQRTYLNRVTLDAVFEGDLKKGNTMEFFDGLQPAEAIREQIPDSFAGLLDLIVCNSVLPAEVIKSRKHNCLIISNQFPARPDLRLLLYKATIRALHHEPASFVDVTMKIRQGLGNYLKNYV